MTHKDCYGTMFPEKIAEQPAQPKADGKVFGYLRHVAGGLIPSGTEISVNQREWDDCVPCEEFEHCYKLCLAKASLYHAVGR